MLENLGRSLVVLQLAQDWFLAQPLPIQVISGCVGLAVIWVLWILLRVILVALRAAFRGL
ncbi:MAG: hypothetical protein LJE70_01385 [Chromatiaceae bacterium]|jgi:hypothetical protein|nr:hypothetical protein [Chromatiaceae bacterium]